MGYIGPDRNATIAAASMHLPQSLFMPPLPPQHFCHVSHIHCTCTCVVYSTVQVLNYLNSTIRYSTVQYNAE